MNKFLIPQIKDIAIKMILIAVSLLIIFLFPKVENQINYTVKNAFYKIGGEESPDTNIVLIHISQNDIKQLGSWPLKRSYYALLIKKLNELKVKKIGIEVFLSPRQSFQSLYNNLLNEEISSADNVVLASIASGVKESGRVFSADSILFPEPYYFDKNIKTGHLNYTGQNGIVIPGTVMWKNIAESSFSSELSGKPGTGNSLRLKFTTDWKNYRNFELVEFFKLLQSKDSKLENFKNKIAIIGVSDPSLAKNIVSPFNDELPGIGLHAMAVDNSLNDKGLSLEFNTYVLILSVLLLAALLFINEPKTRALYYGWFVMVFLIISWAAFNFAGEEFRYAFVLLPLLGITLYEYTESVIAKRKEVKQKLDESEIAKKELTEKEIHLAELQRELNVSPGDPPQTLLKEISQLKKELDEMKTKVADEKTSGHENLGDNAKEFLGIVYRSKKIAKIIDLIQKVAPEKATVLITGESGSGKELVARAIHNISGRRDKNFVAVNCAALSETLLESELFGHVKGAFTNAVQDKQGRFEAADGGTIFLDEIGETSENFQVKLLRVLQTGEFEKVGSSKSLKTDARIVAATNKNLEELVKQRKFREDLYYRLNVIKIELPPLRERKEDISILADHFIKNENSNFTLSDAVIEQLENNDWKGNVRELESVIKRAAIFAKSEKREIIKLGDLPDELSKGAKENIEQLIITSLREKRFSHSSINETAKELGNLNRTVVSENFRGIFFRTYVNSNYDFNSAVTEIAGTIETDTVSKVASKAETYLSNIRKDLNGFVISDFEKAKETINSKYKNLPHKFHIYLDGIVRQIISNPPEK